ncbi:MAG: hypothetical protein H0T52_10180 [Lautropia sp.]|nr:hypothetical protein [Lautropia sp.]
MQTRAHVLVTALRLQQRLRPAILDQGLIPALRWLVDDAGRRSGMTVDFQCNTDTVNVDAPVAVAVYRTLQESMTNIMKHARTTKVEVSLVVAPHKLSLEIADNGRGIRPADREKPTSFGLRGMAERATRLGGWLEVSSLAQDQGQASGTVVFLSLPLQARLPVDALPAARHPAADARRNHGLTARP